MVDRAASQKIKRTTIEKATEKLQAVPQKPKEELSLKETIEEMEPTLKQVLARGYSYDEVAEMLKETGIQISGATLKQYLPGKKMGKPRKLSGNQDDEQKGKASNNGLKKSRKSSNTQDSSKSDNSNNSKDNLQDQNEEEKLSRDDKNKSTMKEVKTSKNSEEEFSQY